MSPQPLDYRSPSGSTGRPRCAACGSDLIVEGRLTDAQFRPNKVWKLLSLGMLTRTVFVNASACTACGTLTLHVDPTAVVKIAGDPGANAAP